MKIKELIVELQKCEPEKEINFHHAYYTNCEYEFIEITETRRRVNFYLNTPLRGIRFE